MLPPLAINRRSVLKQTILNKQIEGSERFSTQRKFDGLVAKTPTVQLKNAIAPHHLVRKQLKSIENQQLENVAITQFRKMPFKKIREAAYKCLRSWVSPVISKWSKNQGLKFIVSGVLRGTGEQHDNEDVDAIIKFINSYEKEIAKISPTEFDPFIDALGAYGGNKNYVVYLRRMQWPKDKKPSVVFGRAVTTAFYDFNKHVITLDPWKLNTWTQMLDALTFECQNAIQRNILKETSKKGGVALAETEYESDKMYVNALLRINEAKDLNELVNILKIPKAFLKPADFETSLSNKKVERPDRNNLPEQNKRQALWWWKTQSWPDRQRKKLWILENHGEGVASSVELYS